MKVVTPERMEYISVETLGLDASCLNLASAEAIACALRRASSFLCPCTERTLIRAVLDPLYSLHEEHELPELVEQTLEALVAHGDLLELQSNTNQETTGVLLYAAPPSFVRRTSGSVLVLGVAPDGITPFTRALEKSIEYLNHVRLIPKNAADDVAGQLKDLGFIERPLIKWMKAPGAQKPRELLDKMTTRLKAEPQCGAISDLLLLDPDRPVNYYTKRWVVPSDQTGVFVTRRPRTYGADLWCLTELRGGSPVRILDLPVDTADMRGCDEGWRIQSAIDFLRGVPQVFRKRRSTDDFFTVEFFSPIAMWARRRLDAIGEPVTTSGCLFAYRFSADEIEEEIAFITKDLWLVETPS